jgi:protein-S-isoprenylcysteine O-methyltransferase Ste14
VRTLARHLLSILILPVTMTIAVPWWLASHGIALRIGAAPVEIALQLLGLLALGVGLALFGASLWQFAVRGRGTLAPWDPPRHLVVEGPYRYVRNPMISGVIFVLIGESLVLLSVPHGWWALLFLCLNLIYIPLVEEPALQARFGEPYTAYCRNVRMVLPRLRPWTR